MTVPDLRTTALALLLVFGLAAGSTAQEAGGGEPTSAVSEPAVVANGDIGTRSEALSARLEEIDSQRPLEALEGIEARLQERQAEAAAAAEVVEAFLAGPVTPLGVEAQLSSLAALDGRFGALQKQVVAEANTVDGRLSEVGDQTEFWIRVREQARSTEAPDALLRKVDQALAALAAAKNQLGDDLALANALQGRVREARRGLRPTLERVEAAQQELSAGLLVRQGEPVWRSIPASEALVALPGEVATRLSSDWAELLPQARERRDPLIFLGLVVLFLAWFFSSVRAGRDRRHPECPDSGSDALRHPGAAAFLVAVLLMPFLQLEGVRSFQLVVTPLALAAWFRVLAGMLAPALRGPLIGLAVLGLLELLRFVVVGVPVVDRALLGLNLAAGLAGIVWLRRPERLQHVPWQAAQGPWLKLVGAWMQLFTTALAGGLLAVLLGYTALADRIALLAIWGAVLGGAWAALVRIGEEVSEHLVEGSALGRVRMIRSSPVAFLRVWRRGLRGLGLFAWVYATLNVAGLWSPARSALAAVLSASIGYGPTSLSLGGVLAFFLTLWISWLIARFTSFALDQEVFSRLRMPPGVPFALSTFTRYAILVIGFVIAMGAVGFPIDRVTMLLSALGVGIGFGLQNVVNNFVSGVILLFERPIRVGDRVQLDDVFGDVSTIGIRASKVRTVDGADVIVPNGEFISARVTNWTYADRKRRMILPIGVAYGTQPRRVIELLSEVARSHPDVVAHPEPVVLFRGFGESSLDFEIRAFTEADWHAAMSNLAVAASEALEAAGITIPFPQRDLHLRNVPELRDALKQVVHGGADGGAEE